MRKSGTKYPSNYVKANSGLLHIVFEYCDAYTNGEWVQQECYLSSVAECKKLYGLGVDCDYRIIKVEPA